MTEERRNQFIMKCRNIVANSVFPKPQQASRGERNQEGERIRKEVRESVIKDLLTALTENETNGLETPMATVRQATTTM